MVNRSIVRKNSLLAIAAGFAVLLVGASPAAASQGSDNAAPPKITQGEFVRQAISQGVAPTVAAKAWGNYDAMSRIPVASTLTIETSSGYTATTTSDSITGPVSASSNTTIATGAALQVSGAPISALASGDVWTHWSTCTKTSKNVFGGTLRKLQMDKQWTSVGTTVSAPAVQTYGSAGWTWVFEGIVNTNDFYSTANNNSRGAHTSYRQGKFTADGYAANEWVQVKGTSNTSTCTKS